MRVIVNPSEAERLKTSGHPWIFRRAILDVEGKVSHGSLVEIVIKGGERLGFGFYSEVSKIALRLVSSGEAGLAIDWLENRLKQAWDLREKLPLNTNAFRLVNAEGDFLPGLIIDVYNQTQVIKPSLKAWELLLDRLVQALSKLRPSFKIYLKRDERAARIERLELLNGYLKGQGDGWEIIHEDGISFKVDFREGQKTGFYLDQRDNRRLAKSLSAGKRVLNLFCYTGSFSLACLAGGAKSVLSVDSSSQAIALAKENYKLNFKDDPASHSWLVADCFKYLEQAQDQAQYDLIILDPPPFARSRGELKGALRGYSFLNEKALHLLGKEGLLFTFSCSQVISRELFAAQLKKIAKKSGRRLYVLADLEAAADHPYYLLHPEGDYLKGFLIYAE